MLAEVRSVLGPGAPLDARRKKTDGVFNSLDVVGGAALFFLGGGGGERGFPFWVATG